MRLAPISALFCTILYTACAANDGAPSEAERDAIAETLRQRIAAAHEFAAGGDQVERLMSLYPEGRVVSTSGGLITTTHDSLELVIRDFWEQVGLRMQNPTFRWTESHVDVLSRDAAVLTGRYSIPHLNPRGEPHDVTGVWTAAFARRGGEWVIVQEHLWEAPPQPTQGIVPMEPAVDRR